MIFCFGIPIRHECQRQCIRSICVRCISRISWQNPCGSTSPDTPIDLSKIKTPTFILSTREDHIAPWKSTYAATHLYSGPVKFVLVGFGPYGWRDQPTRQQVWPLGERQFTAEP